MAEYKVYGFAKLKPGSVEPEIGEFKKAGVDVEITELKLCNISAECQNGQESENHSEIGY